MFKDGEGVRQSKERRAIAMNQKKLDIDIGIIADDRSTIWRSGARKYYCLYALKREI